MTNYVTLLLSSTDSSISEGIFRNKNNFEKKVLLDDKKQVGTELMHVVLNSISNENNT